MAQFTKSLCDEVIRTKGKCGLTRNEIVQLAWIAKRTLDAAPQAPSTNRPEDVPGPAVAALREVLRITDRDHEAWKRAHEELAAIEVRPEAALLWEYLEKKNRGLAASIRADYQSEPQPRSPE